MPILSEWNLSGKNILITADRRGWTPYLADYLSEAGANLIIAGNSNSDMKDAAASVKNGGKTSLTIETNLLDETSIREMVEKAYDSVGQIHCLVNNAKADFGKRFETITATLQFMIVGGSLMEFGHHYSNNSVLSSPGLIKAVWASLKQQFSSF